MTGTPAVSRTVIVLNQPERTAIKVHAKHNSISSFLFITRWSYSFSSPKMREKTEVIDRNKSASGWWRCANKGEIQALGGKRTCTDLEATHLEWPQSKMHPKAIIMKTPERWRALPRRNLVSMYKQNAIQVTCMCNSVDWLIYGQKCPHFWTLPYGWNCFDQKYYLQCQRSREIMCLVVSGCPFICLFSPAWSIWPLGQRVTITSPKACSGRTRGAKNRDRRAHFDRRELAQVDAKSSHFFSRRAPADRRGKVTASWTWAGLKDFVSVHL